MTTKGSKTNAPSTKPKTEDAPSEDIFAGEQFGQFGQIPPGLEAAIGALCRITIQSGGYFGLSVTDDGGSCRLAIRSGGLSADRRFYALPDLETAIARCYAKLRGTKGL